MRGHRQVSTYMISVLSVQQMDSQVLQTKNYWRNTVEPMVTIIDIIPIRKHRPRSMGTV